MKINLEQVPVGDEGRTCYFTRVNGQIVELVPEAYNDREVEEAARKIFGADVEIVYC